MEVWIETIVISDSALAYSVTSHVEVWIETKFVMSSNNFYTVTSHVEVWIETHQKADLRISV